MAYLKQNAASILLKCLDEDTVRELLEAAISREVRRQAEDRARMRADEAVMTRREKTSTKDTWS